MLPYAPSREDLPYSIVLASLYLSTRGCTMGERGVSKYGGAFKTLSLFGNVQVGRGTQVDLGGDAQGFG